MRVVRAIEARPFDSQTWDSGWRGHPEHRGMGANPAVRQL